MNEDGKKDDNGQAEIAFLRTDNQANIPFLDTKNQAKIPFLEPSYGEDSKEKDENKDKQPEYSTSDPIGGLAGYGIDEILRAPFSPPKPHKDERGPDIVDKLGDASHHLAERVGPSRPGAGNLVFVGIGIFLMLLGLLGIAFSVFGIALASLIAGFVIISAGALVKF